MSQKDEPQVEIEKLFKRINKDTQKNQKKSSTVKRLIS